MTKVKVASAKGAHAVIIVDKEDSTLTAHDLQNIIVADDGYGSTISIPSILISKICPRALARQTLEATGLMMQVR